MFPLCCKISQWNIVIIRILIINLITHETNDLFTLNYGNLNANTKTSFYELDNILHIYMTFNVKKQPNLPQE